MSPNSDGSWNFQTIGPRSVRRLQMGVQTLIALVACSGAILWAWRYGSENDDPVRVEARSIQRRAIGMLQSGRSADRVTAIRELERVGFGESTVAIPPLIGALEDPETGVRVAAAGVLGSISSGVVKSGSGGEAVRAATAALVRCLKDPDPGVRSAAATSLGEIALPKLATMAAPPIDPQVVMDALAELLSDHEAGVRRTAINALSSHPRGSDPPRGLAVGLKDESAEIRAAVVRALISFRQGLDSWVPTVLQLAEHDPDPSVRGDCLITLRFAFKPPAVTAAVVPALIASLRSGDAKVRSEVVSLLSEFKADARAAIPELLRILNEPLDPAGVSSPGLIGTFEPACEAASALGQIAPGSAEARKVIAALMEVARSGPLSRRGWAARALGQFGPAAAEAVPVLSKVITDATPDDDFEHEASAVLALGKIAPNTPSADEAVAALLPVLQSEVGISRAYAIEALRQFGPQAAAAIPRLRALKDDRDALTRDAAAKALLAIEKENAP